MRRFTEAQRLTLPRALKFQKKSVLQSPRKNAERSAAQCAKSRSKMSEFARMSLNRRKCAETFRERFVINILSPNVETLRLRSVHQLRRFHVDRSAPMSSGVKSATTR